MHKKTKITLLTISVIGTFIVFLILIKPTANKENSNKSYKVQQNIKPIAADSRLAISSNSPIMSRDFEECLLFEKAVYAKKDQFYKENPIDWDKFFSEKGYTIDQVTVAIEHVRGSNWAAIWRATQLRKNAPYIIKLRETRSKVEEEYKAQTGNMLPEYFNIRGSVPSKSLVDVFTLTRAQQIDLLNRTPPSIDDIAYFLTQEHIPDEDILLLMDHAEDLNSTISYAERGPLFLIDYVAQHARAELFQELLNRGIKPSNEEYVGNTLEWALYSLNNQRNTVNAKKIIDILNKQGMQARSSTRGEQLWVQVMLNKGLVLSPQKIQLLRERDLDVKAISSRQGITDNPENQILKDILIHKENNRLNKAFHSNNIQEDLKYCSKKKAAIAKLTASEAPSSLISKIKLKYQDDPYSIIPELYEIDPSLVNCYLRNVNLIGYKNNYRDQADLHSLIRQVKKGKYQEAINSLPHETFNQSQKNALFWELIRVDISILPFLIANGITVEKMDYSRFDTSSLKLDQKALDLFEESGIVLSATDTRGLTLLYHAASRGNLELLELLAINKFPYLSDEQGADPLHAALNVGTHYYPTTKALSTINYLMAYKPGIDQYHLARMATIKIMYPDLYDDITRKYPQLSVKESTKPPVSVCQ